MSRWNDSAAAGARDRPPQWAVFTTYRCPWLRRKVDGVCPLHFPFLFFFFFFYKKICAESMRPKSRCGFVFLTKVVIPSLLKPHRRNREQLPWHRGL